jgi:hypothetical protein
VAASRRSFDEKQRERESESETETETETESERGSASDGGEWMMGVRGVRRARRALASS